MFERHICPVCWAFQDPDTGNCLVCGKTYTVLNIEPLPLRGFGRTQDFAIPIHDLDRNGYLTIQGCPEITIENSGRQNIVKFSIEAHPYDIDNKIFSIHLN